jgi:hypothetical protein
MEPAERNLVLVIGNASFDATEFDRRQLQIKRIKVVDAAAHFNAAKAVMVADAAGKFALIKSCLADVFQKAADHELAQVILVHSLSDHAQVDALRKRDFPQTQATIVQYSELWRAAEAIARHRVGPPAGDVKIEPDSLALSEDAKLLLQRAFFDCERIFLERLLGGRASMSVYQVHAWLLPEWCIAGPRPLPFFIKIDEPAKIDTEKNGYQIYAEHFIPFNLRPNIDRRRCVRTRSCAALAGDFVDDAIPLRKCLKLGLASGVLFALFETSLKGFRLQPFAAGKNPEESTLPSFVTGRAKADQILPQTIDRAKDFGLTKTPVDMLTAICAVAQKIACLMGPCHGDLHCGNIMVRGGDAILIDFASAGNGPLTADPAALEVSLMFGTDEGDDDATFAEWRAFVDSIYEGNVPNLHPPALAESRPGAYSWLRRSIRELRHTLLGCNVTEAEAKIVLATYLIRFARLPADNFKDETLSELARSRQAYALVVAERIVDSLVTKKGTVAR